MSKSLSEAAASGPDADRQLDELRRANITLQRQLAKAKAKVDDLVHATVQACRVATLSMGPVPPVPAPKRAQGALGAEVALLDTGDWQYGKETTSYNSDVAEQRVMQFIEKALKLTSLHRKGRPVDDCVLIMGGDMVEGVSFQFPGQPFEIDSTLFDQYTRVSRLIVRIIRTLLADFHHVTVVAEWGNHGRLGSKRDAVPRSDNLDRMAFQTARMILEDEPRLTWSDSPEDVQRLVIGNYRAVVLHGDEVGRNGFASPSTLMQHMNRWKSGAYRVDGEPWPFRDAYIHHFHTHNEWALADGEGVLYQTGSTESDNRYAGIGMASAALPSQRLHFIDPDAGVVTAQYKIRLS